MNFYELNTNEYLSHIVKDLLKQQENILLNQLGDLVKMGFLVIESTQPILVRKENSDGYQFSVEQACRLVLKDKEYIEKLEKKNAELQTVVSHFEEILKQLPDLLSKKEA